MTLQFGVNPYDRCPDLRERYHVIDPDGYIVAKYKFGHTGESHAGKLSDEKPGTFRVIDTRDGSEYAAWNNGEDVSASS